MLFTRKEVEELKQFIIDLPPSDRTTFTEKGELLASNTGKKTLLWLINSSQNLTRAFETSVPMYSEPGSGPSMEQLLVEEATKLAYFLLRCPGKSKQLQRTMKRLIAHLDAVPHGGMNRRRPFSFFIKMTDPINERPLDVQAILETKLEL